jgi:menaquinol-cytochrome c reductase iron-sulfur subunit
MDQTGPQAGRRGFLRRLGTLVGGAIAVIVPPAAGLKVFLEPLRRKSGDRRTVRLIPLAGLPQDGSPRRLPVMADRVDAWTRKGPSPLGVVYVRRTGDDRAQAFHAACPHAGCLVDYEPGVDRYVCPCHNSSFTADGQVANEDSPSPRGLDELKTEVRDGNVFVEFQNFRAGAREKIPA